MARPGVVGSVLATAALVAGCVWHDPGLSVTSGPSTSATASGPALPVAVLAQVTTAIGKFDRTAAGPIAGQQQALLALVAPGQLAVQRACPPATTTLYLDPVYSDLQPSPAWTPKTGTMAGTIYSLPTLIRIFTAGRVSGSDVADLHVAIDAGRIYLTAFCVA